MNPQPPTSPLDPEERALAQRLARLGPHGEPSPALDAKVLAAAHAAATARRHRTRWPLRLGVAASVALAVGLAWQLRPLPGADPAGAVMTVPAPEPESTPDSVPAPIASESRAAAPTEIRQMAPPPRPPPKPAPVVAARRAAAPAAATAAPSSPEPAVVFDLPTPADATQKADAIVMPPPAPPAPARPRAASRAAAQAATQASEADAPEMDVPPATVASPEVRDAWLARIRALLADGHVDEARASLDEFQRRYPHFVLPEDLLEDLREPPAP